jgi:hypothetical protein
MQPIATAPFVITANFPALFGRLFEIADTLGVLDETVMNAE